MKTARIAHLEGAHFGELLTLARGMEHLTIPAAEAADLIRLIQDLLSAAPGRASAPTGVTRAAASAIAVEATPAAPPATAAPKGPAAVEPAAPKRRGRPPKAAPVVAAAAPAAPAASAAKPVTSGRRGRVWEGIQDYIRAQGRPQTFDALLRMVIDQGLTDRNPEHALRIAVGKKLSAEELLKTADGRFTLPGGVAPVAGASAPAVASAPAGAAAEAPARRPRGRPKGSGKAAKAAAAAVAAKVAVAPAAVVAEAPKARRGRPPKAKAESESEAPSAARKHRPGALWKSMREWLSTRTDGATREELMDAAAREHWTNANSVEHAMKICLTRVDEQLEVAGDRFYLKGMRPTPPPLVPKMLLRKKKRDAGAEEATPGEDPGPAPTAANPATDGTERLDDEGGEEGEFGGRFDASKFYHKPRTAQPR